VGWWSGDGNPNDIAGNNNGTLQNGATFVPGIVAQAFSFDGVNDAVVVPDAPDLNPIQQLTIEAWVFPTANSGSPGDFVGIIVNKESEAGTPTQYEIGRRNEVGCGIPTGNFALGGLSGLPSECSGWVDGNAFLPLNTWSHIGLTFDGTTVRAYANGALTRQVAVSGTLLITNGSLRIGARVTSLPFASFWAGDIDEVSLYNRVLSDTEIQAIFDAGSAGKCKETDNDRDGVPNDEDLCPNSDLSGTVVIDGCDSGVPNSLFSSGCTISDLIAECAEGVKSHGQFVRCVSNLTDDLRKAGTITPQQTGAIQSCAAQADIP
jgi:hypothetical protein